MSILNRRAWLASGLGLCGASASGWFPAWSGELVAARPKRQCILLWMTGGPSQIDTFDMKPDHPNGGELREAPTCIPGLHFSEHLPRLAAQADKLAIVRSLHTKEADHGRGTFLMRTGRVPTGPIQYPTIGSALSKELSKPESDLPAYVSISPYRVFNQAAFQPGFLGPNHAALTVGASDTFQAVAQQTGDYATMAVDDLAATVDRSREDARLDLWRAQQNDFLARHDTASPRAHETVYERAVRLMRSRDAEAFNLSSESAETRERYGRGRFGQGCLLARRLIERGVAFVEVSLGTLGGNSLGWDTHQNNFAAVRNLSAELDAGWGNLLRDLTERGLIEDTTILWMGEFGRTPTINGAGGRDHFATAWTAVLAGGGIAGGQAYGATSPDGTEIVGDPVSAGDLLATLCAALSVSPQKQNMSELRRPIPIAEGRTLKEVLS